jgi:hypothetical protein
MSRKTPQSMAESFTFTSVHADLLVLLLFEDTKLWIDDINFLFQHIHSETS